MPPTITKEGQRAKGRLAEFRENINNGATATQARANVRAVEAGLNNMQPTVSADTLVNPPPKVTTPVPQVNTNDGSRTQGIIDNVTTNTQGFIQSESENAKRRDELASLMGNQTFDSAGQRTQLNEQYNVPTNLTRLTDIQTQLTKANTDSNIQKTQIANAAGQTLGQAQREVTQQDRENAVRNAGLAAEAAVLQGSIETASTLINQAMSDFYQDRTLKNQNMIQQLEYFSGLADVETKQLIEKEKRTYEEDQRQIIRAQTAVDAAVTSGYASNEDIKLMTEMAGDPASQAAYAQRIVAKSAYDSMALDRAYKNAQIANVYDSISARQDANNLRLAELAAQTNKDAQAIQEEKSLATEKALSIQSLAEKIKLHPALSTAIGPISSTGAGAVSLAGIGGGRAEVNALIDQLAGQLTLDNTKFLKGAMSDRDIELITAAASRLKAKGVSESSYNEALNDIIKTSSRSVQQNGLTTEQATFYGYLDENEATVVDNMFGTEQSTPAFNPNMFYAK